MDESELHNQLLSNLSDDYDKTTGYLPSDLLKSISIVLAGLYAKLDSVEQLIDVDNLTGEKLEQFIEQRTGITKTKATNSVGVITVNGNGQINIGDLFETKGGIQFQAIETKLITTTGTVNIEASQSGSVGNVPANQIVQIPVTISGITSIKNPAATHDGFDAETDDSLRDRYYLALKTPATSGNQYHYLQWAKSIAGVGDAKVFPLEQGDNTVEVVIIDQNKQPASTSLVASVQEYIDPNSAGLGSEVAPIGCFCYVTAAIALSINVQVSVTKSAGYTDADVLTNVQASITAYLKEVAFKSTYVSYAKLGEAILNSVGVEDYSGLTVNSQTDNVNIADKEVAILGGVTIV
ncbi:baseplate J/gp47 family protein [Paenibacillus sp. Root444D2]|uniref:baseplate J/gp47 family protein n=1 Tax=Paenibacillus sp. Root444D2 TaxID=1736538 RepID=UPI00070F70F2|nr:baseplate J/gp47 family protein [Paenibacillus sp. Root444D2]KQX69222.1 hypothetical protein ASD40_01610 [Paenibacillus sp. Root444D2]